MQLNSLSDARAWAESLLEGSSDASPRTVYAVAEWIWREKPTPGCTYEDHPVAATTGEDFYDVLARKTLRKL